MRSGTGLCTVYIPECGYDALQISIPEVMVLTDKNTKMITKFPLDFDADVFCFGMGAGTNEATANAFGEFLETQKKPVVIDASAFNFINAEYSINNFPQKTIFKL